MDLTVTISVDPALKSSGRYGGNLLRQVYLSGWLYVDGGMGVFAGTKVIGTGSVSPKKGPAGFGTNTVAFNPDAFLGSSTTFKFDVTFPVVTVPTPAILRLRGPPVGTEGLGRVPGRHAVITPAGARAVEWRP